MPQPLIELPVTPPRGSRHKRNVEELLIRWHAQGYSLELCGDRRHLNRRPSTLQRYARRLGLSFPDYQPRALRQGT